MKLKELREQADWLFGKASTLMSLRQEIAENFYPERADFTYRRSLGMEFAPDLYSSYPLMCRRELADQFGTMLRPSNKEWAHMALRDESLEDNESRRWMEWATGVMRRAMYDPITNFTDATKLGDHDFATFGNCALSIRLNRNMDAMLYRCFHLRDVVWMLDGEMKLCGVFRRWTPTVRDLQQMYGASKVHSEINNVITNGKPFTEVKCLHMVVRADLYTEASAKGRPWMEVSYDCEHEHLMDAVPQWVNEYIVPGWQRPGDSQYSFSPAVTVALPEARLLQAMTYTLLEAGEKVVNPPMVATIDVVRSDMAVYAGGVTWIDRDYDERLGEALRPMSIDAKGMPLGVEMQDRAMRNLASAFYLNKLKPFNPSADPQMTAFQAGQIVSQYIRDTLPLFEPMEMNYNGALCETTFQQGLRVGLFGPPESMPRRIRQALAANQVMFRFESPLHDAIEAQKGQKFLEMKQMIAAALDLNPTAAALPDTMTALRDALSGIKVPSNWLRSETDMDQMQQQEAAAQQSQKLLSAAQQGSDVVATLAGARKDAAAAEPALTQ